MNLPNLTHFLISNRCYGASAISSRNVSATHAAELPNAAHNDYGTVARGFGIEHVFCFDSLDELEAGFGEAVAIRAPQLVVLEVEPLDDALAVTPLEGPQIKYRFGRHIERTASIRIFEHGV